MVRRRLISMLSAIALVLTLFTLLPEGALKAWARTGTGTQSNPYVVTTYDELKQVFEDNAFGYIKLGNDIISEDKSNDNMLDIKADQGFTLDLAGHSLTRKAKTTDHALFNMQGQLEINDSVGGGSVVSELYGGTSQEIFYLSGNDTAVLTINAGNFTAPLIEQYSVSNESNLIFSNRGGSIYINGGCFTVNNTYLVYQSSQRMVINGGTFNYIGDYKADNFHPFLIYGDCTVNNCEFNSPNCKKNSGLHSYISNSCKYITADGVKKTKAELNNLEYNKLIVKKDVETVSTVNVTLTEPVAGVAINETMISDTTGASVYQSATSGITNKGTWYHGETAMSAGDKFASGETYTAHFLIKADQGYEFADSLSVKVNGDTATLKRKINNYYVYEISYTVASAITTVSIVRINVTKPEAGEIPEDATVFALTGKVPATVRTAWYHGDTQMASGEKFIAGETYTVKLLITRKASYEFSSPLKVFINNERVTSTNNSYSAVAEKSFTVESGQRLVGDVNGDGLISADDAIIVARYAANYGNYQNEYDANVCDMNRDGHVTADDAIIIARYSANYGNYRDIYTNYV